MERNYTYKIYSYPQNLLRDIFTINYNDKMLSENKIYALDKALECLSERQLFFIDKRYKCQLTLREIGCSERLSYQRVMAIIMNAVEDLRGFLLTPIEKIGIITRGVHCLRRAGYKTVFDILDLTKEDMLRIRNMGKMTAEDIMDKISYLKK